MNGHRRHQPHDQVKPLWSLASGQCKLVADITMLRKLTSQTESEGAEVAFAVLPPVAEVLSSDL